MAAATDDVTALTVSAFAEMVSSDNPVPGGGAVAGVVAGLAASLAGMAGRYALKHTSDPGTLGALVARADELRLQCCELADADTHAYAAFAAAQQIPSEDGGHRRRLAMQAARDAAAAPPLELADAAREIAAIGLELVDSGSPHLRSDACAAALFAAAAAATSAILVGVNVSPDSSDIRLAKANQCASAATLAARQAAHALGLPETAVTR